MILPFPFVGIVIPVGVHAMALSDVSLPITFVFGSIGIEERTAAMPFVFHVIAFG